MGSFSWLGLSAGVVVRDASRAGFPKAEAELPHSRSVLVPQGFLSARACSRFAAEGSLLPGVGRSAWIAWRGLLVVGLQRWGDGARRQQGWLCQSGSRASAVQKRSIGCGGATVDGHTAKGAAHLTPTVGDWQKAAEVDEGASLIGPQSRAVTYGAGIS
jgi:hypothetical protein